MINSNLIVLILVIFLIILFIIYEKKKTSIKEISLTAVFAALAGALRVPFAALPNVQPTTFLVIISGWVFGPFFGFMVGSVSVIVSNSFLGHGPWTPWQMLGWGLAGMISGLAGRFIKKPSRIMLSIYGLIWGFLFDYILNIWHWLAFIYPHTIKSFMAVFMLSVYFDIMHGICNFLFMFFFSKDLIILLNRFKNKMTYKVIKAGVYDVKENNNSSYNN